MRGPGPEAQRRWRWGQFAGLLIPCALANSLIVTLAAGAGSSQEQASVKTRPAVYQGLERPEDWTPALARLRAWEQLRRLKTQRVAPSGLKQQGGTPRWVPIGPSPQLDCDGCASSNAGRVTCLAVDPTDTNHWYLGGAQGGVWESRDAGTNWQPLTDDQPSLAMGALAIAPGNPRVIYAGTGEPNGSEDSYGGVGLLKTTDGGASWTLIASKPFLGSSFSGIVVDPSNADVLVAATAAGIAGPSAATNPPTGVFKSSDGGATWTQVLSQGDAYGLVSCPGDFSKQCVGASAVYRSLDGGVSWDAISPISGIVGRVQLAVAPSASNVVYASIADRDALAGVWMTTNVWDAAPAWAQLPSPPNPHSQWHYNQTIVVDPTDATHCYLAGTPLWSFDGSAWRVLASPHVDHHALVWAGSRLLVGNDGGAYSTPDGGKTWETHNRTLSLIQFYAGALHPTNPNMALAGSQDNGIGVWRNRQAWTYVGLGDGVDVDLSPTKPDTDWIVEDAGMEIYRTKDGGRTLFPAGPKVGGFPPFVGRLAVSPNNGDCVLAAATFQLWKSQNFFSGFFPFWSSNSPAFGPPLRALAFAAADTRSTTYAVGTSAGTIFATSDGGQSWTAGTAGAVLPARSITSLAFHPNNPAVLYASLSDYDENTRGHPGHVFKTTNLWAATPVWFDISPPVNLPCHVVTLDPRSPDTVYVGTDLGLWESTDAGASWQPCGPDVGLPNVAVFDLKVSMTGRVIAFTHGRGAFSFMTAGDVLVAAEPKPAGAALSWPALVPNATLQWSETLGPSASWTDYPFPVARALDRNQLAVGNGVGQWVATGRQSMLVSADGTNWSVLDTPTWSVNTVAYADRLWVAADAAGGAHTSGNGIVWNRVASPVGNLQTVARGDGLWVGVGLGGIVTSRDGRTWTVASGGGGHFITKVRFAAGQWLAVGFGGVILGSADGSHWAARTSPVTRNLSAIAYGNLQWLIVGAGGTALSSPDGQVWTAGRAGTNDLTGVAWSGTQWVAVGKQGAILSSGDGVVWVQSALGGADLWDVAYGGGQWVAVGDQSILTSPDTVTWASVAPAATPLLLSVAYGNGVASTPSGFFRLRW